MNLSKVSTSPQSIEDYREFIPDDQYEAVKKLSKKLKGLRVAHINATPEGGGVAEILKSLVPLMASVGLEAEWYVVPPKEDFF